MKSKLSIWSHASVAALATAAGLGAIAPAFAAAADAPPAALEEIVVTALRRSEKIQDAPAAITALSSESLTRLGVKDFNDYYRAVPSLQITANTASPGASRITIRGVWAAGESTVGLYYGDTAVTGPAGSTADAGLQTPNLDLFDVERVEVLRGPQGTLYGSGSVGGTLRVVFKKPDANKFGGHVEAEGATTEHGGDSGVLRGAINIPIVKDKLAVRAVAYTQDTAGYVDNIKLGKTDINGTGASGGRVILAYTPSDTFDLTGTAIYQKSHADDNATWYQSLGSKAYRTDTPIRVPYEDEMRLFSATANWTLPFGKLTATSSYYKWDLERNVDVTGSLASAIAFTPVGSPLCAAYVRAACAPAQLAQYKAYANGILPVAFNQPLSLETQTHEVRLSSPGGGMVDWTVGLFYEKRDDRIDSYTAKADVLTGDLLSPAVRNGYSTGTTELSQFSQFGELAVRPITGLTITAGARHYKYDKTIAGQVLQTNYVIGSFAGAPTQVDASKSGWVGKVNVSYKVNAKILTYAQWAQGFRPGGANRVATLPANLVSYQPDSLDSYEAGIKTSWANGRLTINAAAFQIDWSNMQATLTVLPAFRIVTNAGDSRIRGLEFEATARPYGGLLLNAGASYIPEAKLTSGQSGGAIVVGAQNGQAGDRLPYTAKFTATASVQYDWTLRDGLDAFARVDANYHGKSANEFRPTYGFYETLKPFTEVNARIGLRQGGWGLDLFAKNLTGVVGPLSVQSSFVIPPYNSERQLGSLRPRTIGVNISRDF